MWYMICKKEDRRKQALHKRHFSNRFEKRLLRWEKAVRQPIHVDRPYSLPEKPSEKSSPALLTSSLSSSSMT
jgi:hypothetical protein